MEHALILQCHRGRPCTPTLHKRPRWVADLRRPSSCEHLWLAAARCMYTSATSTIVYPIMSLRSSHWSGIPFSASRHTAVHSMCGLRHGHIFSGLWIRCQGSGSLGAQLVSPGTLAASTAGHIRSEQLHGDWRPGLLRPKPCCLLRFLVTMFLLWLSPHVYVSSCSTLTMLLALYGIPPGDTHLGLAWFPNLC